MITFLSRIYALQLNRNLASSTYFAPPLISFIFKFLFGILWKASCNWSRDQVIRYFTFINFLDIVHTINNNSGMANCLCKPLQEMVTNFNFFFAASQSLLFFTEWKKGLRLGRSMYEIYWRLKSKRCHSQVFSYFSQVNEYRCLHQ